MKILLCLLLVLSQGCVSYSKIAWQQERVQTAKAELLQELDKHTEQWSDTRKAGRRISRKYGQTIAYRAVLRAWDENVAAPVDLACDPYFLKDEKSKYAIRLGWLVCYPERWQVSPFSTSNRR